MRNSIYKFAIPIDSPPISRLASQTAKIRCAPSKPRLLTCDSTGVTPATPSRHFIAQIFRVLD